jgi:hypothetical protein
LGSLFNQIQGGDIVMPMESILGFADLLVLMLAAICSPVGTSAGAASSGQPQDYAWTRPRRPWHSPEPMSPIGAKPPARMVTISTVLPRAVTPRFP